MTGYEKSPDYGGPSVRWWSVPLGMTIMLGVSGALVWWVLG